MLKLDETLNFHTKKNDLLSIGEILIDLISNEYDANSSSNCYHKHFGGSPSNIAMNAKKLGIRSVVASAVGQDGSGDFLLKQLQDSGMNTECIQTADEATSMVMLTKSQSTPTPIFYREADYQLVYTPKLEHYLNESKILHFSCWPISRSPARHTIEKSIEVAKENGLLICFDPNYHERLWEKGMDGISYIQSIIAKCDIVKPSEDDAERLFGRDLPERYIEKFLKLGAKLVILTLGKNGAMVSNGSTIETFSTLATNVVDTTGAGDAFWSGFYAGIVTGYTIRKSIQIGFATSAYKLQYTGAVVDLPKLEVLCSIYQI
ncbi:carbohydrate kinase family protein [Paenibacillus sp. FSL H8-0259]|uniref:carbohydrate kinase family protein n=1 Tax=Paenibacillus sp. FSL H8-0259 TaxID=1920423 RepID=UPI00096C4503|nr:sugar kinase [Paenibacillus sp. FSL H8-0259]OMF28171.1 carbohydrate kinase [Paenibacillus sp. FSL H8-0259]